MSMDRLIKKIVEFKNPTVAGLDPKLDYLPEYIKEQAFAQYGKTLEGAAAALLAFNKGLIDALYDIVPAVKPQAGHGALPPASIWAMEAAPAAPRRRLTEEERKARRRTQQ